MQPDGLNANSIRKNYGGKQPKMRNTLLTSDVVLGPYHVPGGLSTGDTQTLVFPDDDVSHGPFWMTEQQKQQKRYDIDTGTVRERNKTRDILIKDLQQADPTIEAKGNLKKLQDLCENLGISTKYQHKVIVEGWANKPKGSLQILYERGFIDPLNIKDYKENGSKDEYGIVREETALKLLMKQQHDFMTEVTLLQLHAEKLGVMIDRSPKCHPEIAGEGIEYVWSLAKLKYRFMRINAKRSTKGFHDAIATATSTDNLTKIKIRKCSKRARRYMLAYWAFQAVDKDEQQPDANNNAEHITHLTHKVIEKAIKTYKRHRTVDNIDPKWIQKLVLEEKEAVLLQKVVKRMTTYSLG